jgi:hypothetical protein
MSLNAAGEIMGRFYEDFGAGKLDAALSKCAEHLEIIDPGMGLVRVVNHRPLRSVLLWSELMGEHFAGTRHAKYFLSVDAANALHEAIGASAVSRRIPMVAD